MTIQGLWKFRLVAIILYFLSLFQTNVHMPSLQGLFTKLHSYKKKTLITLMPIHVLLVILLVVARCRLFCCRFKTVVICGLFKRDLKMKSAGLSSGDNNDSRQKKHRKCHCLHLYLLIGVSLLVLEPWLKRASSERTSGCCWSEPAERMSL